MATLVWCACASAYEESVNCDGCERTEKPWCGWCGGDCFRPFEHMGRDYPLDDPDDDYEED